MPSRRRTNSERHRRSRIAKLLKQAQRHVCRPGLCEGSPSCKKLLIWQQTLREARMPTWPRTVKSAGKTSKKPKTSHAKGLSKQTFTLFPKLPAEIQDSE